MTGGLGFVKDGMNAQKSNRKLLSDLNSKYFKSSKSKSDFSRKYQESTKADEETLKQIRTSTLAQRRKELVKPLCLILFIIVILSITLYLIYINSTIE
jgi:hypothetical protein